MRLAADLDALLIFMDDPHATDPTHEMSPPPASIVRASSRRRTSRAASPRARS